MEQNNSLSQAAEKEDIKIYWDEPMSRHTTMQVGGPAAMLAQPRDIRELVSLVYLVLSGGKEQLPLHGHGQWLQSDFPR